MRLENKVALISGGARGQGAAEARLFAQEGAKVVIGDILDVDGTRLASEIAESVSNQQKWDTLVGERSGAGWRSGELPEGPVVASSPFGGLSLHLLPAL